VLQNGAPLRPLFFDREITSLPELVGIPYILAGGQFSQASEVDKVLHKVSVRCGQLAEARTKGPSHLGCSLELRLIRRRIMRSPGTIEALMNA
jgi:hypothetical protein